MLCLKPFLRGSVELACGRCLSCRVNRKQMWKGRIILESMAHKHSAFVTLTYAPEHLPQGGSLSKLHWREFTKGIGYRYFGCGEYGDQGHRPHYHLVLFGLDAWDGPSRDFLARRWPYGFMHASPLTPERAGYVAGYVVKKLTKEDDPRLSEGQIPEFALMSRRPAVGALGLGALLAWCQSPGGRSFVSNNCDVPSRVRIDGKAYELGRTLQNKLRKFCGVPLSDPLRGVRMREYAEKFDQVPELVEDKDWRRSTLDDRLRNLQRTGKGVM